MRFIITKKAVKLVILLFVFLMNCEEKLPQKIEPVEVAEAFLEMAPDFIREYTAESKYCI